MKLLENLIYLYRLPKKWIWELYDEYGIHPVLLGWLFVLIAFFGAVGLGQVLEGSTRAWLMTIWVVFWVLWIMGGYTPTKEERLETKERMRKARERRNK